MVNPVMLVKKVSGEVREGLSALQVPVVNGIKRIGPPVQKVSARFVAFLEASMEALAAEPGDKLNTHQKLLRFGIDLVPGGPAVRTFADARKLYATGGPENMDKARRLCVKSSLELAADGAFIGLLAFKELRVLATVGRYGREARKKISSNPSTDIFDNFAAKLLKDPRIEAIADRVLRRKGRNEDENPVKPEPPHSSGDYSI